MITRTVERMVDALGELMSAFTDLAESIESEFEVEEEELEGSPSETELEIDAAIVNELRAAIESVMEGEIIPQRRWQH